LNNINAPVITLNPDLNVPAYLGDPWFDPGATAVDEEDGDLTDQIVFSGFVDGNTVGVYEVTYTVTDSDGLSAMATRQVRVIDPDNPPNEAGVLFTRTVPAEYVPGMDLVVRVMFRATEDPSSINALGLREAIPEEWAFGGVQSVDGQAVPSVAPENGTRDRLEFAWVDIPAFPYTFEYVLMIPVDDPGGEQTLEGAVEYRATGGGQFTGPAVSTTTGEALNRLQQIKAFLGCGMVADSRGTSGDGVVVAAVLIVLVVMGLRRRESPQH